MSDGVYSKEEIRSCVRPLLKKYHAECAILFGSYARGEAECRSDIDIMIIGGKKFQPTDIFSMAEDIYQILGKDVDVYEQREINADTEFYRTIFREGVRIE
ncbi:MAG: nucleotidyltransferase domain-containing protein [Oscillibacter sp.]|nr:nucleotidyltransferase domain-containing protein [Oscillibacter sp.]